jgi:hypothetical protein
MGLAGRWFSPRDLKFINSINSELFNDMIQSEVLIFKRCPQETKINVYGEADTSTGNVYYAGVIAVALVERSAISSDYDGFGPTRKQDVVFKFREHELKFKQIYPEIGDIVQYNNRYHEINNVIQEQLVGNIPSKSFSIICNTIYSRLSKLSLISR